MTQSDRERAEAKAKEIYDQWYMDQIRQEARDALYIDDEAIMAHLITEALLARETAAFNEGVEAAANVNTDACVECHTHVVRCIRALKRPPSAAGKERE